MSPNPSHGDGVTHNSVSTEDPIALSSIAFQFYRKERFEEALEAYQRILEIRRRELQDERVGTFMHRNRSDAVALAWMKIIDVLIRMRNWDAAIDATREHIAALSTGTFAPDWGFLQLAWIFEQAGRSQDAEDGYKKAVEIGETAQAPERWEAYHELGGFYVRQGRFGNAGQAYERAIEVIEGLRAGLESDESKKSFLNPIGGSSSRLQPFDDYIWLLMEKEPSESSMAKALEISERARARATLELAAASRQGPGMDEEPTVPGEVPSTLHVAPLRAPVLMSLPSRDGTSFVVFYVMRPSRFSRFAFSVPSIYVWIVRPGGRVFAMRLPIDPAELERRVSDWRILIRRAQGDRESRALFEELIRPWLDELGTGASNLRLTIVPHGPLNSMPFAALMDETGYWGLRQELSLLPSMSSAQVLGAGRYVKGDRVLLVGHPEGVADLRHSGEELAAVERLFSPAVRKFSGSSANKAEVVAALPRYPYVLFSTHGKAVMDHPELSSLTLSGGETLSVRDILSAKVRAKVVALSACVTHIGPVSASDDLMSLSRAFLARGADAVLVTLWDADERATVEIVTRFFEGVRAGASAAKALSQAQRDYTARAANDSSRRPLLWAPFVLLGRGS